MSPSSSTLSNPSETAARASVPIFRPIRLALWHAAARPSSCQQTTSHHRHIFHFIDLLASSSSLPPCITLYPRQEQGDSDRYGWTSSGSPTKTSYMRLVRCSLQVPAHDALYDGGVFLPPCPDIDVYLGELLSRRSLLIISRVRSVGRSLGRRCEKEKEKPRVTDRDRRGDERR